MDYSRQVTFEFRWVHRYQDNVVLYVGQAAGPRLSKEHRSLHVLGTLIYEEGDRLNKLFAQLQRFQSAADTVRNADARNRPLLLYQLKVTLPSV